MVDYNSTLLVSEVTSENKDLLSFLGLYIQDIAHYFPHYDEDSIEDSHILLYSIEDKLAGLFIYEPKGDEIHVHVDFIIEEYRDLNIGKSFLGARIKEFKKKGFKSLISLTQDKEYISYLKSIGFYNAPLHRDWYQLDFN